MNFDINLAKSKLITPKYSTFNFYNGQYVTSCSLTARQINTILVIAQTNKSYAFSIVHAFVRFTAFNGTTTAIGLKEARDIVDLICASFRQCNAHEQLPEDTEK